MRATWRRHRWTLARGGGELFEVVRERPRGERLVEREIRALDRLPVLAEDRLEDRLLVGEVVVDVPRGDAGRLGDLADARAAVALAREQLQRRLENGRPALLRSLVLLHPGECSAAGQRAADAGTAGA